MTVRTILSSATLALALLACDPATPVGGVSGGDAGDAPVVVAISAEALLDAPPADALILDVRTPAEYASGHVPDATNVPHDELGARIAELEGGTDRPVVVYCERGGRAKVAAATLQAAGYTNLLHLEGDMSGWRRAGLPVEGGPTSQPQG